MHGLGAILGFFTQCGERALDPIYVLIVVYQDQDVVCGAWHAWCKGGGESNMSTSTTHRLLIVALIALGTGVSWAAETPKKEDAKAVAPNARERSKRGATSAADLQKLFEQASKQRDALIADYDALARQLKDATEEQKKVLKEKMEEQKKAFDEAMSSLNRQLRDEQRKQRAEASKTKK
jgi:hypothetical protein